MFTLRSQFKFPVGLDLFVHVQSRASASCDNKMEPLNTLSIGVQAQAGSKSHQQRNSLSAGTLKKMPSLAELRLRLK